MSLTVELVAGTQRRLGDAIERASQLAELARSTPTPKATGEHVAQGLAIQGAARGAVGDSVDEVHHAVAQIIAGLEDTGASRLLPALPDNVRAVADRVGGPGGDLLAAVDQLAAIERRLLDEGEVTVADSLELTRSLKAAQHGVESLTAFARAADNGVETTARWRVDPDSGRPVMRWSIGLPQERAPLGT